MNAEQVFHLAVEIPDPKERIVFLDQACQGDDVLKSKVEALLGADEQTGKFLETPPAGHKVTLDGSPLLEGPGTVIGPYKLLERIGEGGMAVVYMAQQTRPLKRRVALKIIKLGMDTKEVIARFEVERQALALMDHPNIAKVIDAGATDSGRPYFVMELVRGVSITDYCDANKLSTQERLELFVPVCNAVHHAHQKGIIHRDLKPSNIMVTMHDGKPVPKVIDFGIAKATNRQLTEKTVFTRYAQMIGTPEYMSPEQAEMSGLDVDIRTDIYSLGVVLYELLTGALPFDPDTLRSAAFGEIQRIIREQEPPRPSTRLSTLGNEAKAIAERRDTEPAALVKRLSHELEWIPLHAMRKDRVRRYQSMLELAMDVENYLTGSPLLAGPESRLYRCQKFVYRYRASITTVVGIAVVIIIGLAVSLSMYVRSQRALDALARFEGQVLSRIQRLSVEGRNEAALTVLESMLQQRDLGPEAQLLNARILIQVGRQADAQNALAALTSAGPEIAGPAHYLMARLVMRIDPAQAEEHKRLAEEMLPDTAEACTLRAMAASTPEEALTWLSKALKLDQAHYRARKARALVFYGLGDYDQLAHEVEALIALRPEESTGYAFRAIVRREQGHYESAIEDHNQAIALCIPRSELLELYSQRYETYTRMGDHKLALADAETCVSLEPKAFTHRFRVFASLVSLGDYEAAAQAHKRIIQEGYEWHRQFKWWAQKYVLNRLAHGQEFKLPAEFADRPPFPMMRETARCYAGLQGRATRIVPSGFWLGTWSPDGRYLAYGSPADPYEWLAQSPVESLPGLVRSRGIQILDTQTGQKRRLTSSGSQPVWSHDGKTIAFVSDIENTGRFDKCKIWVIPVTGGVPQLVAPGWAPEWSRDSMKLYFMSASWEDPGICSVQVDRPNATLERIVALNGSFSLSPDEKYLAHTLHGAEIRIVEIATGTVVDRWIPPKVLYDWHVHWSPNGKEICVQSASWYGEIGLWIYNVQTKEARQFIDSPARCAVWSPDGSKLVLSVRDEGWIVELDPNQPSLSAFDQAVSPQDFMKSQLQQHDRMIAADPAHAESYLERALIHLSIGHFDEAQSDLARCGELISNSHDPMIYLTLWWGWRYRVADRFQQAELLLLQGQEMVERFPKVDLPGYADPVENLTRLYEDWGKPEHAEQWRVKLSETGNKEKRADKTP